MHSYELKSQKNTIENKERILTKAFMRAAEQLGLSRKELSDICGPSEASLSRFHTKPDYCITLNSKEGQLAILFVRFYRNLNAIFGGNTQQCQLWLRSENTYLNEIPLHLIQSIEGLILAIQYLEAMRGNS